MRDFAEFGLESIKDKVILITGASNGIGKETALLFAGFGAKLVLTARREDKLRELAAQIKDKTGKGVLTVAFDIASEEGCKDAVSRAIAEYGRIDVLINNAGIGIPTPDLAAVESSALTGQMETNLYGVVYITREALRQMKEQKSGHIVMISSMAGVQSNPVAPLYCTSKFALEGYTEGLRKQCDNWRKDGINIRVTNVKPGSVDSGYWGERAVPREKFMSCGEMAMTYLWVVAAPQSVNITEIRMESRR